MKTDSKNIFVRFLKFFKNLVWNKMSVPSGDYNNYASQDAPCHYGNLGAYNSGYSLGVPPQGKVTSGAYIVPTWSPISYNSLSSKIPSCSGYADITNAYGDDAANCQTTYRTSLCGSCNQ